MVFGTSSGRPRQEQGEGLVFWGMGCQPAKMKLTMLIL